MRQCGDCTACCRFLAVRELGKPAGTPCPHACGRCTIYATRPQTCRDFNCLWLLDPTLPDEWRPDRSGVVMWVNAADKQWHAAIDTRRPDSVLTATDLGAWLVAHAGTLVLHRGMRAVRWP